MPDVDLLWRTGNEWRTSNFLPWHAVYAELYFTPEHWPTSTDATCGKPSPSTADANAATAVPRPHTTPPTFPTRPTRLPPEHMRFTGPRVAAASFTVRSAADTPGESRRAPSPPGS
jgi:hypothetical protein